MSNNSKKGVDVRGSMAKLCCNRIFRFAVVGGVCFALQIAALTAFVSLDMHPVEANCIGFAASAQLNFMLSYAFTWGDSRRLTKFREYFVTWLSFNTVALIALGVNGIAFWLATHILYVFFAVGLANVASTTVTFLCNHHLTFHQRLQGVIGEPEPQSV